MPYPITIICGNAGSGKDTVASLLKEAVGGEVVAQADCIKRLAQHMFGFTDHQLWGPSAARNAPDERFKSEEAWDQLNTRISEVASGYYLRKHFWDLIACLPDNLTTDEEKDKLQRFIDRLQPWARTLHEDYTWLPNIVLSPRIVLQQLGTEIGRSMHPDIWSKIALLTANQLLEGGVSYSPSKGLQLEPSARCRHVFISDGRFHNEVLNVLAVGGTAVLVTSPSSTSSVGIAGHASESELASIPAHWFNVQLTNDHSRGLPALKRLLRIYEALFVGNSVSLSTRQISEAHS